MNVENQKMDYLLPQIEVLTVRVEYGFAASGDDYNNDESDQMPEIDGENEEIEW